MSCVKENKLARTKCKLKDPFPTELLSSLKLGSADGHRDDLVENGFVLTRSIKTFLTDQHSIIVGPFGSGKSALFKLLKNRSEHLNQYLNDLIVPIEEQVQFNELKQLSSQIFNSLNERIAYQLVWRFQICRRVSEEIAKCENFPRTEDEKYIAEFLHRTGGLGGYESIVTKLKNLFENVSFKIKAKLSETPVDLEIGKEANKSLKRVEVNLDIVLEKLSKIINEREYRRATVIIDKLDKFVSGEDYETQRMFLEALLEVEDDLHSLKSISFKVFLRKDLYKRLNLTSIGPDKAGDNTLKLKWGPDEIRKFVANRMFIAFSEVGIWDVEDILQSTDLSEFHLKWHERILIGKKKDGAKYTIANLFRKVFGKKRTAISLFNKFDRVIIGKLFENKLMHTNYDGDSEEIDCHDFFDTHFLDGNNSCTPRYMLLFLKKLVENTNDHYSNSPNIIVTPVLHDDDWVWDIFTKEIVYDAYKQSKEEYLSHASKIDDRWTRPLLELITKKGNRSNFDYKWISSSIKFDDKDSVLDFVVFLQIIGVLEIREQNRDVKKRKYTLPVLYREAG